MTEADRWPRIKEIFQAALEKPAEQRDAWLDEACAGDVELRAQLAEMLRIHESDDSLLDDPQQIRIKPIRESLIGMVEAISDEKRRNWLTKMADFGQKGI